MSNISAESVGDADEAMSKGPIHHTEGPSSPALLSSHSQNSIVTSEHLHNTKKRRRNTIGDSLEMQWTDDKHSSYLNSIEESFVRHMYGREYCAMDSAPQSSEQDCVESHPSDAVFKTWHHGNWRPVTFTRPLLSKFPSFALPPVLRNPWIKHFKSSTNFEHQVEVPTSLVLHSPGGTKLGQITHSRNGQLHQEIIEESIVLNDVKLKNRFNISILEEQLESSHTRVSQRCCTGTTTNLNNSLPEGKLELSEPLLHKQDELNFLPSYLAFPKQNVILNIDPYPPSSSKEVKPVLENLVKESSENYGLQFIPADLNNVLGTKNFSGSCIGESSDASALFTNENFKILRKTHGITCRNNFRSNLNSSSIPGANLDLANTSQKIPHHKFCKWGVLGCFQEMHLEKGNLKMP